MNIKMIFVAMIVFFVAGCASIEGPSVPTSPEPGRSKETNSALIKENMTGIFCSQIDPIDAYPGRNCVADY